MAAKQLDGHPGDRIGDLRTNLGMTKKELSQKTGIDASQITRIENGSLKTISRRSCTGRRNTVSEREWQLPTEERF